MQMKVIKKRIIFLVANIIIITIMILNFLNYTLMPVVVEYGKHQCENISTKLVNYIVALQMTDRLRENIIYYNADNEDLLEFNVSILNSIASNSVKKLQQYFYMIEKGTLDEKIIDTEDINIGLDEHGTFFNVPIGQIFNNYFLSNFGLTIPIRYRFASGVSAQIVSCLEEYGINNALLKVDLQIKTNVTVIVPLLHESKNLVTTIPLAMEIIQGEIPDSFFGSSLIGEVK